MPIIKSAKKKARRDQRKRTINLVHKLALKKAIKEARQELSSDSLRTAQKALDKSVRKRLIHKNKAARLKSRLARQLKAKA